MGKSVRNTDDGLPILSEGADQDTGGLPVLKKKDAAPDGSPSPLDSSHISPKTGPGTSTGDSAQKQATANFKNQTLTPKDVSDDPTGFTLGPSPEQLAHSINNKTRNIDRWENTPSNLATSSLIKQKQDLDNRIGNMDRGDNRLLASRTGKLDQFEKEISGLKNQRDYIDKEIDKSYQFEKQRVVPDLVNEIKGGVIDDDFDPITHTLKPVAVQWMARKVDAIMNKKNNSVINARVSGDLSNKERSYPDLTRSVVDQLNLIPVQKAQQDFTKKYAKSHPEISAALEANETMHNYFSNANYDDLNTKTKVWVDKSLIEAKDRYYGKNGLFMKNPTYVGIQQKYAQLVGDGRMSQEVAFKQMQDEIDHHPDLKSISDKLDTEKRKIIEGGQQKYQNWLIQGFSSDHPKYTVYKDGTIGLSTMPEEEYKKMTEGYQEGMNDVAKKMGAENNEAWKQQANRKAEISGPLWGSLAMSTNSVASGLTKMIFNKTGWGGDRLRHFQAEEMASPSVEQSDVAATWNWKGWESLTNPNFYLSGLGKMVPVIAGAAAVTATTEGAGLPEYVGWLSNAGLFTAQSSLDTYDKLISSGVSESDASHLTAQQAANDFLPNFLMMALTSGTLSRAKNIVKPSIGRRIGESLKGVAIAQPFFSWQGYNDYATMLKGQGKTPDIWDYMQSPDFKDNLVNGLILGGGMALVHTPFNHLKSMENWQKMIHQSDGEFKNLLSQNYALGQEMAGNGGYLRDAMKMHVFNVDKEGLNDAGRRQLSDLQNTLLYSVNLDRNLKKGNLDKNNIRDLYQAHNLALADQYDFQSQQANKEGNKSLSDIYKDKAKDYREQAKEAANDQAKYHYLINDEGQPIFLSDKSFKVLEADGKIEQWIKDKTIQGVVANDDPHFQERYEDYVKSKQESAVYGQDLMDHGKELIEANKDKLGVYYAVAKDNPESFYKEVSDQASGKHADGTISNEADAEKAARDQYGDDIVDLSKTLYPITEKEGGKNAEEMPGSETSSSQPSPDGAATASEGGRLQEGGTEGEKTDAEEKITPEDNITVSEMLDKKGTYKGQRGTFIQDGQTVIFKPDNSNREYELGNINEVGGQSLKEFGIDTEQSIVNVGEKGEITVRDKPYVNPNEDPLKAIVRDDDGNVISVKLETPDGQRRTFRGQVAEDLAYELTLKQISNNNEQSALEDFINTDEAAREEINNAGPATATEEPTTGNNEPIQREKIEPISSHKTEADAKKTEGVPEAEGREGDVLESKEGTDKESTPPSSKPTSVVDGPPPSEGLKVIKESPKEEFTSVRKEKQKEIEGARELFDKQKVIKWSDTYTNAMSNVQSMYPNKPLYEALRSRVGEFVAKLDNNILYNPTSEDIAAFNVFKHITKQKIGEIAGWESSDDVIRAVALAEFSSLHTDLFNVVRINNPGGEAGRAFGLLQSEIAFDPDHGLQIRRMELLGAKRGSKLTADELAWSAEQWEKERTLMSQQHEAQLRQVHEKFEKEIARLREQQGKPERVTREKGQKIAQGLRDFANKLEKFGKPDLPEGTERMGVDLQKNVADAIRWIADKIASGDIRIPDLVYAAIEKFKGKESSDDIRKGIHDGMLSAGVDDKTLKAPTSRQESFKRIREEAVASGATAITKEMAGKNLIRDYVKSFIGIEENKDIVSQVMEELKSVLPDVDENMVRKSYLKEDEYRQPTKKELENSVKEATRNFEKLTKIEKDITDLTEKQNLFKRNKTQPDTPYDKEIESKEKEKKELMTSLGVKTSGQDKYAKASYDLRAASHNERIDDVNRAIQEKIETGDLSGEQKKLLTKLKNQLDAAKAKLDPTSKLSQDKVLEAAISAFKGIHSEFNRSSEKDIVKIGDIRRRLQKIADGFNSDKEESEQDIKIQRTKDRLKQQTTEYQRKLAAGEFEDNAPVILTKADAELIRLQSELSAQAQAYDKKKKEIERKSRSNWARLADVVRGLEVTIMIGSPSTLMKVAGSALLRPQLEAATKLTVGKGFEALPFNTTKAIVDRAKLGGESLSLKSIAKGYEAYFRQYSDAQLLERYTGANDRYEKADHEYELSRGEMDKMDKDTPDYKGKEKELQGLKNTRDNALLDAVGNVVYQYIAGSSVKEAGEALFHRTTKIERMFGQVNSDEWQKGFGSSNGREKIDIGLENFSYLMNFVGRSHAALKNFSARQSFASGFMARLEGAVRDGMDVTKPDKLLELANESYADWDRGKYQDKNWISDTWNKVTNAVDKVSPEMAYLLRADIAITRVPVNMLREGIMEYVLGAFTGSVNAAKEYYKAKGIVLNDGFTPERQEEFRTALKDQLQQIDPDKAATILRSFRKGGFGLGLYALALLGHAAFGGFAHKGQTAEDKKKKQREDEFGIPVIKTGEIKIGNWLMPEAAAKIVEHTPAFQPMLFGLGLAQVYENNIKEGKSTTASVLNDARAHIEHTLNSIPQMELVGFLGKSALDHINVQKRLGEWQDVDENGNPIIRKAYNAKDYVLGNRVLGGDPKNILSDAYYKMAVKTNKYYEDQIAEIEYNPDFSKKEKEEERQELLKKRDEDIEDIYRQNKENPQ